MRKIDKVEKIIFSSLVIILLLFLAWLVVTG